MYVFVHLDVLSEFVDLDHIPAPRKEREMSTHVAYNIQQKTGVHDGIPRTATLLQNVTAL